MEKNLPDPASPSKDFSEIDNREVHLTMRLGDISVLYAAAMTIAQEFDFEAKAQVSTAANQLYSQALKGVFEKYGEKELNFPYEK